MNEENLIKEYFKNKTKRQIQQLFKKFYKEKPELKQYCENILFKIPEYEKIENVVYCIVFDIKLRVCKTCGKYLKYSSPKERIFCSCKCAQSNEETKKKMSQSICNIKNDVDKYNKMIEKRKTTCLKNFGVEYSFQAKEVKEKINETNLKKYGSTNIFNNEKIAEKRRQSYLKHFRSRSSI